MEEKNRTKEELLKELAKLRQRIDELKKSETELKKAKEALRESEEMYKTLLETSFDAVNIHDLDTKFLAASERALKMGKYQNSNEIVGQYGLNLIPSEYREEAKEIYKIILTEGFVQNMELPMIRADGTQMIGEFNATLFRDAQGKPKGIIGAIRDVTEKKKAEQKLQQEVKNLRQQVREHKKYPEIIGNSAKILQLIDLVQQIARTNSTVLIYGETGSGKDLIAKAVHYNSSQKYAPFLAINCAALPEQLIESELFGYAKGAFTGATQDKKGLFEDADKGTIFLNEIGEIPLRLQAKLLQVLENQQIRRLGQSKNIKVDVRIIAACNIDLEEAVNNGTFRKDLFFRLNVLLITVPPLRERKEDIPLLAKHFLDKHCPLMNKQINDISKDAMDLLCGYSYPGNVRELENIMQHAIVIAQGTTILPKHLPEKLRKTTSTIKPRKLAKMDKEEIVKAIKQSNGNLTKAAKKLGVHRITLWRKRKELDI
jgi:PAS domain S-box-containing protein